MVTFFLVFTCFGAENGDPVVNRGPQFFFFLFMNLNLTHHLKRFAVPALNHKSTYYKMLKANIYISQFLIIVLKTSVLARVTSYAIWCGGVGFDSRGSIIEHRVANG